MSERLHLCVGFFNASQQFSLVGLGLESCAILCFRCNLASLLTIALHGKLEYYTSIMKDLLVDLIDASASKNPKLMLRRTESVVEKMLTNWMSICMYSYLRVREPVTAVAGAGSPLCAAGMRDAGNSRGPDTC